MVQIPLIARDGLVESGLGCGGIKGKGITRADDVGAACMRDGRSGLGHDKGARSNAVVFGIVDGGDHRVAAGVDGCLGLTIVGDGVTQACRRGSGGDNARVTIVSLL